MYLKRLELQGFKSFADKTVLDFGQGVTSVVGPNGSGKSNISDAIRWVMGEMSAKSLRGSNMQDVIFAGTETRKQVNFAEVSLVLDNSSRLFPIEFDEVVVTRRVFRSGESVYQINKANCRLKDIVELFMDTGLGRDGYSIIGQGNVSKILSTKAEDRRSFFEEAAGVSKYKHRKDEAERKLLGVTENLVRISDITQELERQLGPLENQSKKARKYMELYEEYKGLDVSMCLVNLDKNAADKKKAEELSGGIAAEIEELKGQETEIERKRDGLYEKSKQKDQEQAEKNNALMENESRISNEENSISIAENNIKNNVSILERIKGEIVAVEKKNEEYEKEIEAHKESIKEKEEESKMLMQRFEKIRDDNTEIFEKLTECRKKADEIKNSIMEKMNDLSAKKAEISGKEAMRKGLIERRESVENEQKNHGKNLSGIKQELEEGKLKIAQKQEKYVSMQERVARQETRKKQLETEIAENEGKLADAKVQLSSRQSKRRMLEDMENEYEGYARSVKAVLKAPELKKRLIYGTVSGLVEVPDKYVTAIEMALGGALQNIVVETEDDAKAAILYLRSTRGGRATFLPVSAVSGRTLENAKEISEAKGYVGIASDLIRYDKKYDGIMKNLLARVVVADNIDNAVLMSKKFGYRFKIVTLLGDILNPGGSMSGGSVNKSGGILSRGNEIKNLEKEIVSLTNAVRDVTALISEKRADLNSVDTQLSSYTPLLREYENEILILKNTQEHLTQTLENSGQSERALEDELKRIEEQLSASGEDIARMINDMRRDENTISKLNGETEEAEAEYEEMSRKKDEKASELMDETLRLRSLEKDIQTERETADALRMRIEENKEGIGAKQGDIREYTARNESLKDQIEEKRLLCEKLREVSVKIKEEIEKLEKEKAGIVEGLKSIQNSNKDLTDRMMILQQEYAKAENKLTKLAMEAESIINKLWDDYELSPISAKEIAMEIEEPKLAVARVSELRSKIKALGSVNVDAIEEYKEAKERFDFLSNQKSDLEKSQEDLNKVIASVQELMEEHFQKQFDEINKSFSHVFRELFGGGNGRLYLSDPQDVMESGIEIEVQLPGKGLQNINLYSGGEKSFIAIALLFAILEVKPTPFCILDEIDAALDDVNVSRFATYLKNYLAKTQFIVITHRRGTMEASNIMYGVTMQEKGVSKLLSLHIDDVTDDLVG